MNKHNPLSLWWFSILLLATILGLSLLPAEILEQLDLKHQPINGGEWWRIYTSQVTHLSLNHTFLNFAGYAFVAYSFRDEITPTREIIILFLAASGVGFGIYFLNPEMYSYVGLSGAIYGVLVAFVIIGINKTPKLSVMFLAFIVGKFLFEYFNGGSAKETEQFIGGRVAVESHIYGAIIGILPGIFYYLQDRKKYRFENTVAFVSQFKDPVVRDLAWALHSAPLLDIEKDNFRSVERHTCLTIANDFLPELRKLDTHPEELHRAVEAKDYRLGIYFEKLIKFWLEHQERFDLIANNLPVHDEKITIGEFDFIIKDTHTNETIHWEIAIKFYLGTNTSEHINQFYGPGKKDRLDIKSERLTSKQIQLSNQPAARRLLTERKITIDKRVLFVKGRLFYPSKASLTSADKIEALNDSHLKSYWYTNQEFLNLDLKKYRTTPWIKPTFQFADRDEWLTHKNKSEAFTDSALKTRLKTAPLDRPTVVIVSIKQTEIDRFFIVPDNWANELPKL